MSQKKILFLGASRYQLSAIQYARQMGHYIITCDYLPNNPGHRLADESYNVSTTDMEAVLALSKKLKIDGIVAYATDPAAPTQAYVGNKMGLPSNPYESVRILCRKDLFRSFLKKHHFHTPISKSFYHLEDAKAFFSAMDQTVMVKPIDSCGSKGISKVSELSELETAFRYALEFSKEKKVVVEEFFHRQGYQIGGDGFVVNGKLVFRSWSNIHFNDVYSTWMPVGVSFPSVTNETWLTKAHQETQRLLDLLNIKQGALNFDFHYDKKGTFSFIELSPRNGGNLIPDVIKYVTGIDLTKYTVDSALGLDCSDLKMVEPKGFYACCILYALRDGVVDRVYCSNEIKKKIIAGNILTKKGDVVKKFTGSHLALDKLILKFSSLDEMLEKMDNMEKHIRVEVS